MAAPLITLRKCFELPHTLGLDDFNYLPPTNLNPSSSSATTAETTPPAFAHKVMYNEWTRMCHVFMGAPGVQVAPNLPLLSPNALKDEYLYTKDLTVCHASEGDVVRSAAIYVLYPLNRAFQAHPYFAKTVTCQSESSLQSGSLRADVTYFKTPAGMAQGAEKRAFAVVEFKKRGLINGQEFVNAEKINHNQTEDDAINKAATLNPLAAKSDPDNNTFYKDYSLKLMKQASAYATGHRTKYVALFDWDTLVLVRFQAMGLFDSTTGKVKSQKDMIKDGVGNWCQTTVITNQAHMRPALLGFLAEAHDRTPFL